MKFKDLLLAITVEELMRAASRNGQLWSEDETIVQALELSASRVCFSCSFFGMLSWHIKGLG